MLNLAVLNRNTSPIFCKRGFCASYCEVIMKISADKSSIWPFVVDRGKKCWFYKQHHVCKKTKHQYFFKLPQNSTLNQYCRIFQPKPSCHFFPSIVFLVCQPLHVKISRTISICVYAFKMCQVKTFFYPLYFFRTVTVFA